VPHASRIIPEDIRPTILLTDEELADELVAMTDSYTDELFDLGSAVRTVRFPVSRLVVDPERFLDDALEPMAARGMGVLYERTSDDRVLRAAPSGHERQALLDRFYAPHHVELTSAVEAALATHDSCLLIDCHSFPSTPRSYELDPMVERPDICIGTDEFHTPGSLLEHASQVFEASGWTVAIDRPYAGTLVPTKFYRLDPRVVSIMIEVNRRLYMDERTGERLAGFAAFMEAFQHDLRSICSSCVTDLLPQKDAGG
jgi:N-formylglutamate amidohydrolase